MKNEKKEKQDLTSALCKKCRYAVEQRTDTYPYVVFCSLLGGKKITTLHACTGFVERENRNLRGLLNG